MSELSNDKKTIISLCSGTGAWERPYVEAGYNVISITKPEYDVRALRLHNWLADFKPYGILAAPPCTEFSFARTKAVKPRDLRSGMEVVFACLNIIWKCQYETETETSKVTTLRFWALENPAGLLKHFLGHPVLTFNPFDFGDRYQKKTSLWGFFNVPKKSPIELREDEKVKFSKNSHKLRDLPALHNPMFNPEGLKLPPGSEKRTVRRAITPPGFAKAFFLANQ